MKKNNPIQWRNERRKIADLIPFEGNPRKISKKDAEELRMSLERFGLADLPIIQPDGMLIGGHQRVAIMKAQGKDQEEIEVRVPSRPLTREEFEELNIRLNKNQGEWDWDALTNFDMSTLLDSGFTKEELSHKFTVDLSEDDVDVDEEYAKIKKAKSREGEIYQLGRHRLMCGDSTKAEHVRLLMGEDQADIIFTDPPYNVHYSTQKYAEFGKKSKKFLDQGKILNDDMDEVQFYNFLFDSFRIAADVTKKGGAIYCCFSTSSEIPFRTAFRDAGWHFSQTIVWMKTRINFTPNQDFHKCYEPIMFGWKGDGARYSDPLTKKEKEIWDLDRATFEERLDLWYIRRDNKAVHPTQKPIKLMERALKRSSKLDDILYEPFNGGGSTLIACEQAQRSCRAMELDPKYVDVTIARWEKFTGAKAVKVV